MEIRKFRPEDAEAIRGICLATCTDPWLRENQNVLYTKYADYYVTEEPGNIFVAEDESGRVCGYILCSSDPAGYLRAWKETYGPRIAGSGLRGSGLQAFTELQVRRLARKGYSAHLHIDILEDCQRQGVGTKLVNALCEELRTRGTDGLYLGCSAGNAVGNAFYRKYGFRLIEKVPGCNMYGLKLN